MSPKKLGPNGFGIGRHAADDPPELVVVEEAHWHPLQMAEDVVAQIVDYRLAQFQRQSLVNQPERSRTQVVCTIRSHAGAHANLFHRRNDGAWNAR